MTTVVLERYTSFPEFFIYYFFFLNSINSSVKLKIYIYIILQSTTKWLLLKCIVFQTKRTVSGLLNLWMRSKAPEQWSMREHVEAFSVFAFNECMRCDQKIPIKRNNLIWFLLGWSPYEAISLCTYVLFWHANLHNGCGWWLKTVFPLHLLTYNDTPNLRHLWTWQ